MLDELLYRLKLNNNIDKSVIPLIEKTFIDSYNNGNPLTDGIINNFIKLIDENPNFKIEISDDDNYTRLDKKICLSKKTILNHDIYTVIHEITHAIHDLMMYRDEPPLFENILEDIVNDSTFISRVVEFMRLVIDAKKKAIMSSVINGQIENGVSKIENNIIKNLKNKDSNITKDIINYDNLSSKNGFNTEFKELYQHNVTLNRQIEDLTDNYNIKEGTRLNGYSAIEDMIDAVLLGKLYDGDIHLDGISINGGFGHGNNYYSSNNYKKFSEIFAEYMELMISPDREYYLQLVNHIFGNKFIQAIEQISYYTFGTSDTKKKH